MNDVEKLLVREATPAEYALARAMSDTLPVPIRDIHNPTLATTVAFPFLSFLAAHVSVDLWYEDWPINRKLIMIANAKKLAAIKGTRAALEEFLGYVDTIIIDKVSHPRRFVTGFSAIGVDPIGHKPFTTHLLVKTPLTAPEGAYIVGRSAIRYAALRSPNLERLERTRRAAIVAKSPENVVTINHGHRRNITLDDEFVLDGSFALGDFTDRKRL